MGRQLWDEALASCLLVLASAASSFAQSDARLLDAVKHRDRQAVRSLVLARVDVNVAQPDGATPLAWAVHLNEHDIVDALLAAGANVNVENEYGESPLTLACANGDARLVEKLLSAGANPLAARWNGETALMIAAGAGSVEAVNLLIARGAPVNAAESRKNQTALMWAAAEGRTDVVRALVDKGANVNAAANTGATPLIFATVGNHEETMRVLVAAGANPSVKVRDARTLLVTAAGFGTIGSVRYAYELDPHVDVLGRGAATLMHLAVSSANGRTVDEICEVIRFFAEKGVPLDERDANGTTPRQIANTNRMTAAAALLTELVKKSGATPKGAR